MSKVNTNPMRTPFGLDGCWQVMRAKHRAGFDWTAHDISQLVRARKATVRKYINHLLAHGSIELTGELDTRSQLKAATYRLVDQSRQRPRFTSKGNLLPEPLNETLWRTMKMLKSFSVAELVDHASTDAQRLKRSTVRSYVYSLHRVGALQMLGRGSSPNARYRIINNVGEQAPRVLRGHVVFDPNAVEIIGEFEPEEAAS